MRLEEKMPLILFDSFACSTIHKIRIARLANDHPGEPHYRLRHALSITFEWYLISAQRCSNNITSLYRSYASVMFHLKNRHVWSTLHLSTVLVLFLSHMFESLLQIFEPFHGPCTSQMPTYQKHNERERAFGKKMNLPHRWGQLKKDKSVIGKTVKLLSTESNTALDKPSDFILLKVY